MTAAAQWLCAGHPCHAEPTETQEPRHKWVPMINDKGYLRFHRQPIDPPRAPPPRDERPSGGVRTSNFAALFRDSPMRDRAYRKKQWVDAFKMQPTEDGAVRITRWPMTTPADMRAWGQKQRAVPWELKMDPRRGMTPAEAVETADDIESDRDLRVHVQFVEDKLAFA